MFWINDLQSLLTFLWSFIIVYNKQTVMVQGSTASWIWKSLTRKYPKSSSETPMIVLSWYFWKKKSRTGSNLQKQAQISDMNVHRDYLQEYSCNWCSLIPMKEKTVRLQNCRKSFTEMPILQFFSLLENKDTVLQSLVKSQFLVSCDDYPKMSNKT